MSRTIKKIITHLRPHADELAALMLLRRFPEGDAKFPGVKEAEIGFMTTGELPDGKSAADFPDTIFLGVGGGMFDEHATSKKGREEGEVCVTLVAKHLGLDQDKRLQTILHWIKQEDLRGSKLRNELPMIIKFIHAYCSDAIKVYTWAETAYFAWTIEDKGFPERPTLENTYALLRRQNNPKAEEWKKFADEAIAFREKRFGDAKSEFAEKGKMETITAWDGRPLMVASVDSDNEEMNKYARSIGAHLVVQFNGRGNVSLMTDTKRHIDLTRAFVLLRMAEQHFRGGVKVKDEKELSKEGFVEGIPYWYLFHTRAMGFNGSSTTTDVEPTKIPHEKVIELVKEGLK